jgi:hypothetical protein
MAAGTGNLNLTLNINEIDIVGTPTQSSVFNQFDDFGLLLSIDRLPEEHTVAYKQRLMDVFTHRANSTYLGMIYGVTRELGLSLFKAFRLRPRVSGSTFIGENPIVIFNGPFLELWRDKTGNILEMEIDLFDQTGIAYTIKELYDYINANSTYFIADQLDPSHQYDRSMTIINQTNIEFIIAEAVPMATRFTLVFPGLDGGAIDLNSLIFTDTFTFSRQVVSAVAVLSQGDYYIDAYTGDVTVFSEASIGTIIKYKWIKYNSAYLVASPVIIHNMQNPNFDRIMFQQVLADDGQYYNGVPNEFGADIINELLSVYPLNYSE